MAISYRQCSRYQQANRSHSRRLFPACLVTFAVLMAAPAAGQTIDPSIPLWRQGISTWNGSGYSYPDGYAPRLPAPAVSAQAAPAAAVPAPSTPTPPSPASIVDDVQDKALPRPPAPISSLPEGPMRLIAPSRDLAAGGDSAGIAGAVVLGDPSPRADSLDLSYAEHLNAQMPLDSPPLQDEILRWYEYPWSWMTEGWTNHAEFGIDGSAGNSDTLAIQTGLELERKTDLYTLAIDFDYRQASTSGETSENNGRFNTTYDRLIKDSRWSWFGKFGLEWDRFKAFDLRLNTNGGIGYYWLRTETDSLVTRFGAGASREFGSPIDQWTPEAVFGLDGEYQLTKRQRLKAKFDYFPAFEDFADYRLVTDLAWEILLDNSDNLSLKLALTDRYDSTPQGAEPNDVYYSLLLLYKF